MNIGELIQNIATGGAILLGITYIIGGLIVNLNLARRGLVEYQILKIKYLVVGLIFLLQVIAVFIFASLPGLLIASMAINSIYFFEAINLISLLSGISLLFAWARISTTSKSLLTSWAFWFLASALGYIFPAVQIFRGYLVPIDHILRVVMDAQAILTGILTLVGQIYHYSVFYYGSPSRLLSTLDPIGFGKPSRICIACTAENASLLKNLGVPMGDKNVSSELFLIDETDNAYIIALDLITDEKRHAGTLKVDKSLIRAILFPPEKPRKENK